MKSHDNNFNNIFTSSLLVGIGIILMYRGYSLRDDMSISIHYTKYTKCFVQYWLGE